MNNTRPPLTTRMRNGDLEDIGFDIRDNLEETADAVGNELGVEDALFLELPAGAEQTFYSLTKTMYFWIRKK